MVSSWPLSHRGQICTELVIFIMSAEVLLFHPVSPVAPSVAQLASWTLLSQFPFLPGCSVWKNCLISLVWVFPLCNSGFHSAPRMVRSFADLFITFPSFSPSFFLMTARLIWSAVLPVSGCFFFFFYSRTIRHRWISNKPEIYSV